MSAAFRIPADATAGDVTQLSHKELAALDAQHYSVEDVLVVAALLAKVPKFPIDMVSDVLILADFLVTFEAVTNEIRPGHDSMNEEYLELCIPNADQIVLPHGVGLLPRCEGLVVECTSRDQGWATDAPEHNGTYNASHTWNEVAVVLPTVGGTTDSAPAPTEVARVNFTANFRASRQPRHHIKEFKDPSGLLQHVSLGVNVQLILRSQYPGWANHANYGRIRARFGLDICEDAQLPSIAHVSSSKPTTGGIQRVLSSVAKLLGL